MGDERHKSPYKRGPRREMTAAWRASVHARLKELGRSQEWLREAVGAPSASAITQMRSNRRRSRSSRASTQRSATKRSASFDASAVDDDELRALIRAADPEGVRALVLLIRALQKK